MKSQPYSILFLLLLSVLLNTTNAQWAPVPTGLPNNSQADNATDQVAFLVGHSVSPLPQIFAHISRSTDGGKTFSIIMTRDNAKYSAITFVNEQLGFIAGDHDLNAVVRRTTDGGESWETTMLGIPAPEFQDIYFINENVGFLVGGNGIDLIFKTENGGDTWENITFSDGPTFKDISFVDDSIGFVISDWGPVYKTIDQGETWEPLQNLPSDAGLDAMYFISEQIGMIADDDGLIYRTVDGGDNWTEISLPEVEIPEFIRFYFVNEITGFLLTQDEDDRKLFQTINGGESWTEIFNLNAPRGWTFITFSPSNTNALLGGSNLLYVNTNAEDLVVTTSLEPTIKELSVFDIYPNPSKDEIDISLSFDLEIHFQINLLDVFGKVYESRQLETSKVNTKFMLDTKAPGVYIVQVITKNGIEVKRFVKR